jgi:hypothetical protein
MELDWLCKITHRDHLGQCSYPLMQYPRISLNAFLALSPVILHLDAAKAAVSRLMIREIFHCSRAHLLNHNPFARPYLAMLSLAQPVRRNSDR